MNKRAKIYTAVTLFLSWSTTIIFYLKGMLPKFVVLLMLIPALVAFVMRLLGTKPKKEIFYHPDKKGFFGFMKAVLFAFLFPTVVVSLCAIAGALCFGGALNGQFFATIFSHDNFIAFIPMALISPNIIFSFGEEYGWRGFLLPEVNETASRVKSSTILGVIWALYHFPVLVLLNIDGVGFGHALGLAFIQGGAAFVFSFAFAQCYFLSHRVYPVVIMHTFWNLFNPRILGSIYEGTPGKVLENAPVATVNGEGIFGIIFGGIVALILIYFMRKYDSHVAK